MEPLLARSAVQHYVWPDDVPAALRLLREGGASARLVGGGTDVALHPPDGASTLVDLSRLALSHIEQRDGSLAIGATATLAAMLRHPLVAAHAGGVVPVALRHIGSPALRNVATVGGHVARGRLSDLVPVLLVLDAQLRCFDGAERTVALDEFYELSRDQPMVITDVVLPAATSGFASGFVRFSRTAFDYAMLNCAVALGLEGGRITEARVAVGETPALARRVPAVEAQLAGRSLDDDDAIELAARLARESVITGDDQRCSAEYRSQLVGIGVRRCLRIAAGRPEVEP